MSLIVLAEATAARRWGRVGLVVWAWFCWLQFAFLTVYAGIHALVGEPLWAAWFATAAYGWAYWALCSAARAAQP
jgi:hypothetical protein